MPAHWGIINSVVCVFVACTANAWGAGSCCLPDQCAPAADAAACAVIGGVYLDGAECKDDPCAAGACCSDLACFDGITAFACVTGGRDYAGAGTACADDPCAIGVGACCVDGTCAIEEEGVCLENDGSWLGPGTTCVTAPCEPGACCSPAACADVLRFECLRQNGAFLAGDSCEFEPCEIEDSCPLDSLYGQAPDDIEHFNAYVSDSSAGLLRFDDYYAVSGPIATVRWFGLDLLFDGGFSECDDTTNFFRVAFYEDAAGEPGDLVCDYDFQIVEPLPTGLEIEGFQVHEYRLELPQPCVLTHGWLAVNGIGDDCLFVWYSSPAGNGRSWCDGCITEEELDDVSFCLLGSSGGVTGSCCDELSGGCTDDIDISECTAADQRFTADTVCAAIDPPCTALSGACCFADATPCNVTGEIACAEAGGDWLGDAIACDACPPTGPCCIGDGSCVITLEDACVNEGFLWLGSDLTCDDCPEVPPCPEDSLVGQSSDTPLDFVAGTSEEASPFRRFEDYSGVAGAIDQLTFYGFDLEPVGNSFIECVELDNRFTISFHRDAAGLPGETVCAYDLDVTRTPTQVLYIGAELNLYEVELPEPCALPNGWVSISGQGSETCWFLWNSSSTGNGRSYCDGCPEALQGHDLAVCLHGDEGGVSGACCADDSGVCADDVDISDCTAADLDFSAQTTCAELEPACGVVLGACCRPGALCDALEEDACIASGGDWLGPDTLCSLCPCELPCADNTFPEGEPLCADGYVDSYNGGCDAPPELRNFSNITPCVPICGTTGVFEAGVDFDWYEMTVAESDTLTLTVEAEFPVGAAIVAAESGCEEPFVLDVDTVSECELLEISASVAPGTYWIVVGPISGGDLSACGARYTATATLFDACTPDCKAAADCADVDDNGVRDDACMWWDCVAGFCHGVDVDYGDVGGGFLQCSPDRAADGHDHFHALDCFAVWDGLDGPYPCTTMNVDIAGKDTPCVPDGLCDVNDAVAAMDVFGDISPCGCSQGPAPTPPAVVLGKAVLTVDAASDTLSAGDVVRVDVVVSASAALRAYQLDPIVRGGTHGSLTLVDMTVEPRDDAVLPAASWRAFNLERGQMMAGHFEPSERRQGYLASLFFQATPDAAGRFVIDLRHTAARGDTQLIGAGAGAVLDIQSVHPAILSVVDRAKRSERE